MADLLRILRTRIPGGFAVAVVSAVSDVEGLDIVYRGGLVAGVPFLGSYLSPGVGDVVVVATSPGSMFVLGTIGVGGSNLGANLVPNAGFEFGEAGGLPSSWTSFWSSTIGTGIEWIDDPAEAHASNATAQYATGALADDEFIRLSMTDAITVDPGVTYRLAAWFRGTTEDANTTIKVNVHTAPTADGAQPFGADMVSWDVATLSTTPATWTELSGTRTIPVDHFYLRVFLSVTANAGHTTTYVYADDVSLREQT